jgi:hypothetical protein
VSQSLALPTSLGPTDTTLTTAAPLGPRLFLNTDNGGSGEFATTSQLHFQVGDIEAFQQFACGACSFLVSAGVRVAHFNQEYNAFVNQVVGLSTQNESLLSSHHFTGAGPVLALEARRSLWGNLGLYGTGRGSVLFGSARQDVLSTGSLGDPSPITVESHWDPVITVGELEVGVEYGLTLGSWRLDSQLGLVGQEWFGAGNPSRTAQGGVPTGFPFGAVTTDTNLGFFGLVFRVGINY